MTYPPTPGPPPKPRRPGRTTRTVIIVAAVVALLCCAGALTGGGIWFFRTVQGATAPARDAATAYLDDVRDGNHPEAYARLCEEVRSQLTEEEFARARAAEPPLGGYRVTSTEVSSSTGGRPRAEVTVTGGGREKVLVLVEEGGDWRVCGGL
ncbi:Rv0361 family membrane protein [Micromonospora carbonacea]|uniref:Rv0361 family membrane protein n=1 Tax=Micromonospora carbonacea TaxID=47853 RepID=UPI003F708F00